MIHTTPRPGSRTRWATVLRLLGTGFAVSLGLGFATSAHAAPLRDTLDLQCDTLGAVTITVSGNGPYAPGLAIDGTVVGVPYAVTFTGTFTPHGGDPEVVVEAYSRRPPAHDRLDRCVFSQELTDEHGTVSSVGEVLISYTPR